MSTSLDASLLAQLSDYVTVHLGLHFPRERWPELERGIHAAAAEADFGDALSYSRWLLSSCEKEEIARLASRLTIGETYFFRGKSTFEVLEWQILPLLLDARRLSTRRLSIWSAGCCTGEEPYSIAILLSQLLPDWEDWSLTILATDINPRFLQKAAEGVYGEWSFRGIASWVKERYFRRTRTGHYEILPQIKQRVTFSQVNLAEPQYPLCISSAQPFDIIFCRNVLMYFAAEQTKKTIQNLHGALCAGGWLVVSPSDATDALFFPFERVNFPDAIFYRKKAQTHQPLASPMMQAPAAVHGRFQTLVSGIAPLPVRPGASQLVRSLRSGRANVVEAKHSGSLSEVALRSAMVVRLYNEGRYAEAEQEALWILTHHPQASQVAILLARIYANQGKLAQARQWCKQALGNDRMNPSIYYLQATIQQEEGDLRAAQRSLRQTLYLDPDFVLAHFALGYCALRQGRMTEAKKCFANTRAILNAYGPEERFMDADGLTSAELMEIIRIVDP